MTPGWRGGARRDLAVNSELKNLVDSCVWIDSYLGGHPRHDDSLAFIREAYESGAQLLYGASNLESIFYVLLAEVKRMVRLEKVLRTPIAKTATPAQMREVLSIMRGRGLVHQSRPQRFTQELEKKPAKRTRPRRAYFPIARSVTGPSKRHRGCLEGWACRWQRFRLGARSSPLWRAGLRHRA